MYRAEETAGEFQSALPRGERQRLSAGLHFAKNFNPRSHEGSDTSVLPLNFLLIDFNPRSHEGSDPESVAVAWGYKDFNPRSHEGSDQLIHTRATGRTDFNPRSHEGSDTIKILRSYANKISIRAPTRGATGVFTGNWKQAWISIRAPTRGATASAVEACNKAFDFNPRSHEGSDAISGGDTTHG